AQRALAPGPGRTMAARGMLPLTPVDQLCVLYQLALDGDAVMSATARATAANLPDKLLAGTLVDARLDPRVLDLFAKLAGKRAPGDGIARALQGTPPVDAAADAVFAKEVAARDEPAGDDAAKPEEDFGDDTVWSEIPMRVKVRLVATGSNKRRMEALRDPKGT